MYSYPKLLGDIIINNIFNKTLSGELIKTACKILLSVTDGNAKWYNLLGELGNVTD